MKGFMHRGKRRRHARSGIGRRFALARQQPVSLSRAHAVVFADILRIPLHLCAIPSGKQRLQRER